MPTAKSIEEQIAQFQENVSAQLEPHVIVLVVNQDQDELIDFRIEPSGNMTALLALRQNTKAQRPANIQRRRPAKRLKRTNR